MATTARGFRYPVDASSVDVAADLKNLADDVEGKVVTYSQGPVSARPTSTVGSPGYQGRRYYATDEGIEYLDTGTSWIIGKINQAAIPAGAIDATRIADSLKPSVSAAAGTEALRALGTTASTAAAGNDSRLSNTRTPSNGSVTNARVATKYRRAFMRELFNCSGVIYAADTAAGDYAVMSNGRIGKVATDVDFPPLAFKLSDYDLQSRDDYLSLNHNCIVRLELWTGNTAPGANLTRTTFWTDLATSGTPAASKLKFTNAAYGEGTSGLFIPVAGGTFGQRIAPGTLAANTKYDLETPPFYAEIMPTDPADPEVFTWLSPAFVFAGALAANSVIGFNMQFLAGPA